MSQTSAKRLDTKNNACEIITKWRPYKHCLNSISYFVKTMSSYMHYERSLVSEYKQVFRLNFILNIYMEK